MGGPKFNAVGKQRSAQQLADRVSTETDRTWLGSAKVDLSILTFDWPYFRETDEKAEELLFESFENLGCIASDPRNKVPALINRQELKSALHTLGLDSAALKNRDLTTLPRLQFPPGIELRCLHGRHRVETAKKYLARHLPREKQEWVVDLFAEDLSTELRDALSHQGSDEVRIKEGEVIYHIVRCGMQGQSHEQAFWWTRLQSKHQRQQLRRFLARNKFQALMQSLSIVRALFRDIRAGMIEFIMKLKCDEEIQCYLNRILHFWTTLLAQNEAMCERLDYADVKLLEARSPAHCQSDQKFLRRNFMTGELFGRFSSTERGEIWGRLLRHDGLIPSFYTFFENIKYLKPVTDCMKSFCPPRHGQTLRQSYDMAFGDPRDQRPFEDETNDAFKRLPDNPVDRFDMAYRKIVLCVMQNVEALEPGTTLIEPREGKTESIRSTTAWHDLAQLAKTLGFESDEITEHLSASPDRVAARRALRMVCDSVDTTYSDAEVEPYVAKIAEVFGELKKNNHTVQESELLCSGPGEDLRRRCGRPFRQAYEACRHSISLSHMHQPEPDGLGELSPFFVCRNIYLSFFGNFAQSRPPVLDKSSRVQDAAPNIGSDYSGAAAGTRVASSIYTDVTASQDSVDDESIQIDSNEDADWTPTQGRPDPGDSEWLRINFHEFRKGGWLLVRSENVTDTMAAEIAQNYQTKRFVVLSVDLRTLAPSECWESAREDGGNIYLVTQEEWSRDPITIERVPRRKRKAEEELSGPPAQRIRDR